MSALAVSYFENRRSNLVKFLRFERDWRQAGLIECLPLAQYISQYERMRP